MELKSAWAELKTVLEEVTKNAEKLQKINEQNQRLCKDYREYFKVANFATTDRPVKESKTSIEQDLHKIQEDLEKIKLKASEEVVIEFVGGQSAGKSTLINALLRDERLPAGFGSSTMCITEIYTTDDENWSVTVNGKLLYDERSEEEVKHLLTAITHKEKEEERKKLGINEDSLVRVFWPKRASRELPKNVVLIDSPGYGEKQNRNDNVQKSCKKADILVAVMNPDHPSLNNVGKLVTKVDCKYVFGVFTKWDKAVKKSKKENSTISLEALARDCKQGFFDNVNTKCQSRASEENVFFVDSKHVVDEPEEHKDSPEVKQFKEFEKRLAESSGEKWKQQSLKEEVTRAANTAQTAYEKFKRVMEERTKEKSSLLTEKLKILKDGEQKLLEICERLKRDICKDLDRLFGEMEDSDIIKRFEKELNDGKTTETKALQTLSDIVDEKTKRLVDSTTNIVTEKIKKWDEDMEKVIYTKETRVESKTFAFKFGELPPDKYDRYNDPAFYLRNKYVIAILTATVFGATGAGAGAVALNLTRMLVLAVFGTCTTGGCGLGYLIGLFIEKYETITGKKLGCWVAFLKEVLSNSREIIKNFFKDEIDKMLRERSTILNNEKSKIESNRQTLTEETDGWFEALNRSVREVIDIRENR